MSLSHSASRTPRHSKKPACVPKLRNLASLNRETGRPLVESLKKSTLKPRFVKPPTYYTLLNKHRLAKSSSVEQSAHPVVTESIPNDPEN